MQSLQERLAEVMAAMGWEHADVMRVSGQSSSVVSQWLGKSSKIIKTIGKIEAAQRLSDASGYGATWIAKGIPPKHVGKREGSAAVAHEVSYTTFDTPPLLEWEEVMDLKKVTDVPSDFMLAIPDEALAARGLLKGERVWFKAASVAQPRNVVLIEANGRRYIRRYTESGRAEALDSAFDSFEPGAFRVVAVMHMRPQSSI